MKPSNQPTCLLILGCGYVGSKLAQTCLMKGIKVKATTRNVTHASQLQTLGIIPIINSNPALLKAHEIDDCDALLDSIPLTYHKDRVPFQSQSLWVNTLSKCVPNLHWAGYLSSTSVYADSQGNWVSEETPVASTSQRGLERIKAEHSWLNSNMPAEIFRLAGIYGDERNILRKLFAGNYKSVAWQPAHYSNRVHVDDIVASLMAAMFKPLAHRIVNLTDDEPCPHADYVNTLAKIISAPKPIILTHHEAEQQLSPAFLDFFRDNKRISNKKLHQELLPTLKYPSFRDAIPSLLNAYKHH